MPCRCSEAEGHEEPDVKQVFEREDEKEPYFVEYYIRRARQLSLRLA